MSVSNLAAHVSDILELAMLRGSEISPIWVATEVMSRLGWSAGGPKHRADPDVYAGCHEAVRQITRQQLRKHDPVEAMKEMLEDQLTISFPATLQRYYPRVPLPNADPAYVRREDLEDEDIEYNADRMERAGNALLKHADALRAWGIATRAERAARRRPRRA